MNQRFERMTVAHRTVTYNSYNEAVVTWVQSHYADVAISIKSALTNLQNDDTLTVYHTITGITKDSAIAEGDMLNGIYYVDSIIESPRYRILSLQRNKDLPKVVNNG